jgi:phosphatidylserine decarboxylase
LAIITKDGLDIVITTWFIFLIFLILTLIFGGILLLMLTIFSGIFAVFNMSFFRDPERKIPDNPDAIVSPADGKVVLIEKVNEKEFFNMDVMRVSIFLSVFNVHVNRSPISGKVEHFAYKVGAFLQAFRKEASVENEQTAIGIIDDKNRKVMFTQIAGILARRIICRLREGHQTSVGDRMGMIRYGSRVDVYFRENEVDLSVKINDRVKGGESIIGVFK